MAVATMMAFCVGTHASRLLNPAFKCHWWSVKYSALYMSFICQQGCVVFYRLDVETTVDW